jgi:hypothetical protein
MGLGSEESWKLGSPRGLAVRTGYECLALKGREVFVEKQELQSPQGVWSLA